ncbi:hypothetical protein ACFWJ5_26020 [Streptomyces qaidamensis]|uniref:hypothetical protein n=1 Tax=Streptomyces qaidamensis TaxID=1783515 RepID=UPI00365A7FF2
MFDGIDQELKDTADLSDSDIALVTGLGTDGQRWQAWLNEDSAAALLTEEAEDLSDGRPS